MRAPMTILDDCICGEINARHCPVHNESDDKFERELKQVTMDLQAQFRKVPQHEHLHPHVAYRIGAEHGARWGRERAKEWMYSRHKLYEDYETELAAAREEIERLNLELGEAQLYRQRCDALFGERDEAQAMCAELARAWYKHQKTKFLSDGSHFQADVELNEVLAKYEEWKK